MGELNILLLIYIIFLFSIGYRTPNASLNGGQFFSDILERIKDFPTSGFPKIETTIQSELLYL